MAATIGLKGGVGTTGSIQINGSDVISVDAAGAVTGVTSLATPVSITSPTITGTPVGVGVLTLGSSVTTTSGTTADFTGIPDWVKRITISLTGVSTNDANNKMLQLGTSAGIVTSGYVSTASYVGVTNSCNSVSSTAGFITFANAAADVTSGHMILTKLQPGNTWVCSFVLAGNTNYMSYGGGYITLPGVLDKLRLIGSTNGVPTGTFDAGTINILYE